LTVALIAGLMFPAAAVQAEEGDYSFWQTLSNLIWPRQADNPVTPEQRTGDYPLLANPSGFDDGFSAGNYGNWQTIQLTPETGAVCGNGSPYKFFLNRAANTSNTLIYMEGGGACWDYAGCKGLVERSARNPDGIPDDYMSLLNPGSSLVSPFVTRVSPFDAVKTQDWNLVYVPYCTGDLYTGDKVAIYDDPSGADPEPLVYHHNGMRNSRAVVGWLKDNLQRPAQLMSTGCSAGGGGSLANYHPLRRDIAPNRGYLLDDAGPIFDAPTGADPSVYPSAPLHDRIRSAWGLSGPLDYLAGDIAQFDPGNLGTLAPELAETWSGDRLGISYFWQDLNYSVYSYAAFHDDIIQAPDEATGNERILARWRVDTARMADRLDAVPNFGYYLPQYRALNDSHCTTIVDFKNGDIQAMGLELKHFIDNLMEGSGPVMQASEEDDTADKNKPFNLLYFLVNELLGV
jgi:hypothetical protein